MLPNVESDSCAEGSHLQEVVSEADPIQRHTVTCLLHAPELHKRVRLVLHHHRQDHGVGARLLLLLLRLLLQVGHLPRVHHPGGGGGVHHGARVACKFGRQHHAFDGAGMAQI